MESISGICSPMETNRIRQFCTLAENLNLREASEILGISHSGLFKSMKLLQEELDIELFQKEGRGLGLTDKGKLFYPKAKRFLAEEQLLLDEPAIEGVTNKIGTYEIFSTYLLSDFPYSTKNSESWEIHELIPGEIEKALLDGRIDYGITDNPVSTSGLSFEKIGAYRNKIYVNKKLRPALKLSELSFVVPISKIKTITEEYQYLDGWPTDGPQRDVKFKVNLMETGLQLCAHNEIAGYFPDLLVEKYNQTVIPKNRLISLEAGFKKYQQRNNIFLVTRKSFHKTDIISEFKKFFRSI